MDVLVVDRDIEGADPDEIMSKDEILEFCGKDKFIYVDYKSGISDVNLSELI